MVKNYEAPQHNSYEWGEQRFLQDPGWLDPEMRDVDLVAPPSANSSSFEPHSIQSLKGLGDNTRYPESWSWDPDMMRPVPRISHPNVASEMITTQGQYNSDPMGGLRVSRNDVAKKDIKLHYPASSTHADAMNTKLRSDAEEIDRSIAALDELDSAIDAAKKQEADAKFWQRGKIGKKIVNMLSDKQYIESRALWLSARQVPGEKFDKQKAVAAHDAMTKYRLHEERSDGVTVMDRLHEQALRMAKEDGVEVERQ